MNHLKHLRVLLPAILFAAFLLVLSCNNETKTETNTDTSTIKTDPVVKDNTDMTGDTTLSKDTTKGEQTPPPK